MESEAIKEIKTKEDNYKRKLRSCSHCGRTLSVAAILCPNCFRLFYFNIAIAMVITAFWLSIIALVIWQAFLIISWSLN